MLFIEIFNLFLVQVVQLFIPVFAIWFFWDLLVAILYVDRR